MKVIFIGGPWHGELREFKEADLRPTYNVLQISTILKPTKVVEYKLEFEELPSGNRAYAYVFQP